MNSTFQRVASFCGLRLSYYTAIALLAIAFLVLAVTEYRTPSPLYMLLTAAVLPALIRSMFFPVQKEKRENTEFPLFCKKYHYNSTAHKSMNIAFLLLFFLLAAWHISYHSGNEVPALIAALPALFAVIIPLIRILSTIGFRLYFHFFPLKAMR